MFFNPTLRATVVGILSLAITTCFVASQSVGEPRFTAGEVYSRASYQGSSETIYGPECFNLNHDVAGKVASYNLAYVEETGEKVHCRFYSRQYCKGRCFLADGKDPEKQKQYFKQYFHPVYSVRCHYEP